MLWTSLGLWGVTVDDYTPALRGGILIGLASWILLAGVGRSIGVSSIASRVLSTRRQSSMWRWAFLFGLVATGSALFWLLHIPAVATRHALVLIPAGFLVGFGAVLGSGSASGHAVFGLGRHPVRSLVAVITFTGAAVMTVTFAAHLPSVEWWTSVLGDALAGN